MAESTDFILSKGGPDLIDVTFRRARPGDVDAMYELSRPFMDSGALIVRDREFFVQEVDNFRVMEVDRTVVACAGFRRFPAITEVLNIAVADRWQGFGLGRLLLASMIALVREWGHTEILLFSKTTTSWFRRHGFVVADPGTVPPERLAALDPERNSTPLRRSTVPGEDGREVLAGVAGLRVRFARSDIEARWEWKHDTLLKLAFAHDIEVDSLCWGGICGTCSSRLKHGTVAYHVAPEVDPEEGEVLLCIAQPVTDLVVDR